MSTVETHTMPNGQTVYYRDSDHQYNTSEKFTRATRIPGISTISKHDGDGNRDPLMDWAVRLAYEGVAQEASLGLSLEEADDMRSALAWLDSARSVEDTLRAEGLLWRNVRDAKGRVGGVSHGVLQALAEGTTPILRSGYDHAVIDWWKKRKPEPLNVEQVVFSAEHGFAGRFDLRAGLLREDGRGGLIKLIDLKTSGFISNAFHIQLAGYELAAKECGIGGSDEQIILQVREDGSWHEWLGHAHPVDFLSALRIYEAGKRIGSAARKDWRAMKDAARKQAEQGRMAA